MRTVSQHENAQGTLPEITVIDYSADGAKEWSASCLAECAPLVSTPGATWINVDGLDHAPTFETLNTLFGVPQLVIEDIMNADQRPKLEEHDDFVFVVVKMLRFDDDEGCVRGEHVGLILLPHCLISFQEAGGDVFDGVRNRIRANAARFKSRGCGYLLHALLDAVVDEYFVVLERLGDCLEAIEDDVLNDPSPEVLKPLHHLRGEAISLRRSVWPLRETASRLDRLETPLIDAQCGVYFRDLYDHTVQVVEATEAFRDSVAVMVETYLSSVSHKTNLVMQFLTIISTIFIPLTFLAGVYGMNFRHMPELEHKWAYPAVWGVMLATAMGMIAYFRRQRWM